MNIGFVFY